MRKFSKKKTGGDCNLIKTQFSKVNSFLGPDGSERKVIDELYKSLEGANEYIENFLLVKIKKLNEIFNSNTDRKKQILEIINQIESKLKEVEQENTTCYEKLKVDPKGEEFGIKTADEKMKELYGENPDEYNNQQVQNIYDSLKGNPVVGYVEDLTPSQNSPSELKQDDRIESNEDNSSSMESQDETDSNEQLPDWKKMRSDKMFTSFNNTYSPQNYFYLMKKLRKASRRKITKDKEQIDLEGRNIKERQQLYRDVIEQALQNAQTPEEVDEIIKEHQIVISDSYLGGGKSKRINKLKKYRSRKL